MSGTVSLFDGHIDRPTDNEIKKALECCEKLNHNAWSENMKICKEECPYKANCYDEEKNINMITDALDLINRQQAEIENLKDILYDAEGVNLVNYWHQQYAIAENGCKNFNEENKNLKAEIERLQNAYKQCAWERDVFAEDMKEEIKKDCSYLALDIKTIKAEAIKEFAERLKGKKQLVKANLNDIGECLLFGVLCGDIDNLVKEMKRNNNAE